MTQEQYAALKTIDAMVAPEDVKCELQRKVLLQDRGTFDQLKTFAYWKALPVFRALGLCLLLAVPASAQVITDTTGWMRGHMDVPNQDSEYPQARQVVSRSSLYLAGWVIDCKTYQQPTSVQLMFQGEPDASGKRPLVVLSEREMYVRMRIERPDVAAWLGGQWYGGQSCALSSPHVGYYIVPPSGLIPLGPNVLALFWTDPLVGVGVQAQQVAVEVVE